MEYRLVGFVFRRKPEEQTLTAEFRNYIRRAIDAIGEFFFFYRFRIECRACAHAPDRRRYRPAEKRPEHRGREQNVIFARRPVCAFFPVMGTLERDCLSRRSPQGQIFYQTSVCYTLLLLLCIHTDKWTYVIVVVVVISITTIIIIYCPSRCDGRDVSIIRPVCGRRRLMMGSRLYRRQERRRAPRRDVLIMNV